MPVNKESVPEMHKYLGAREDSSLLVEGALAFGVEALGLDPMGY